MQKPFDEKFIRCIQEMLFTEKNINYNDIETYKKRGSCCYYIKESKCDEIDVRTYKTYLKDSYILDKDIPIFTQDRNYIQKFVDIDNLKG